MQEILMHFLLILMTFFLLRVLPILESLKYRREIKKMIHKKKRENASRLAFQNLEALSLFSCRLFFTSCRQRVRHWKLSSLLSKPCGVGLETKNCVYKKDWVIDEITFLKGLLLKMYWVQKFSLIIRKQRNWLMFTCYRIYSNKRPTSN